MKKPFMILCLCAMFSVHAEEEVSKQVMITPSLFSVEVTHDGRPITIQRNQDRKNHIVEFFRPTYRGKIQPMHPFKPHAVETIGELDMLDYLVKKSKGDDSILIIDSRTPAWVKRGTIPGSVNIPFTVFKHTDKVAELMEESFGAQIGETWDFSYVKTLVMFCNGNWCPQSPTAIRKLLALGYPAAKIKYFRGGMQSWSALGLTVVKP